MHPYEVDGVVGAPKLHEGNKADLAKLLYRKRICEQEEKEVKAMFQNLRGYSELKPMLSKMMGLAQSRAKAFGANSQIFQRIDANPAHPDGGCTRMCK